MAKWMDMTNSLCSWQYGVVGIIRVELETARALHKADSDLKFSVCDDEGFREVQAQELDWLWNSTSAADAYMEHFKRNVKKEKTEEPENVEIISEPVNIPSESRLERMRVAVSQWLSEVPGPLRFLLHGILKFGYQILKIVSGIRMFFIRSLRGKSQPETIQPEVKPAVTETVPEVTFRYPYRSGDVIFSCGWMESRKEEFFSKLKNEVAQISLIYLVYDIVLIKEGLTQFYDKRDSDLFREYLEWVSNNCDHILYWGKVAQNDTEDIYRKKGLRIPEGSPIFYGSGMKSQPNQKNQKEILERFGLNDKYVMMVGSVEPRKNYDTIYKAYSILTQNYPMEQIPQCVIVGGKISCQNLIRSIENDPVVSKKMFFLRPSDEELDVLYKNAEMAMLPSLYEGWSLVLLEILNYGRFCLTADVPPLREVAEGLVKYLDPNDPVAWSEAIIYYTQHGELIKTAEEKIKKEWNPPKWDDGAIKILQCMQAVAEKNQNSIKKSVYYDLTLAWIYSHANASISGIPRVHLTLARYLSRYIPDMKFCAMTHLGYHSISKYELAHVLGSGEIDQSFNLDKPKISAVPGNRNETGGVLRLPFKKGDLVFTTGVGYNHEQYEEILAEKERLRFLFSQLIYDFTPVILPNTHNEETLSNYPIFLKYASLLSDVIFYGGETAMRDGIAYEKANNLPIRPGCPARFGSDFSAKEVKAERLKEILGTYGIKQPYVLTVGTIQARKNQETLYKAYLRLLDVKDVEIPQLVICGFPGWNTEDFVSQFKRDERVKDKVVMVTLSDEELNAVYRNCEYTLLPSLYEGWSLTLPESLNYNKFCIASDVDPLKEIGGDFIDYVQPFDTKGWADRVYYYAKNPEELRKRTERIRNEWHSITWDECAQAISSDIKKIQKEREE